MKRSRMIQVRKRNGSREPFDEFRLAGVIRRAVAPMCEEGARQAGALARAVHLYLQRRRQTTVSSTAVFEMVLKVLRRVDLCDAAEILELHRSLRRIRRRLLRIGHDDGNVTRWEKDWLARLAARMWHVSYRTGRILAGEMELELLGQRETVIARREVINRLNEIVVQWGLADAVPVQP